MKQSDIFFPEHFFFSLSVSLKKKLFFFHIFTDGTKKQFRTWEKTGKLAKLPTSSEVRNNSDLKSDHQKHNLTIKEKKNQIRVFILLSQFKEVWPY